MNIAAEATQSSAQSTTTEIQDTTPKKALYLDEAKETLPHN